jgi:hypothetical protein
VLRNSKNTRSSSILSWKKRKWTFLKMKSPLLLRAFAGGSFFVPVRNGQFEIQLPGEALVEQKDISSWCSGRIGRASRCRPAVLTPRCWRHWDSISKPLALYILSIPVQKSRRMAHAQKRTAAMPEEVE